MAVKEIKRTFIQFTPTEDKIKVNAGFNTYFKEDDKGFDYYIEGLNLYFSADTKEVAKRRMHNMITAFFNFWIKKQGEKKLLLELHKLGFRAPNHNYTFKQLLNSKSIKTRMDATPVAIPAGFDMLEENEYELEVA